MAQYIPPNAVLTPVLDKQNESPFKVFWLENKHSRYYLSTQKSIGAGVAQSV